MTQDPLLFFCLSRDSIVALLQAHSTCLASWVDRKQQSMPERVASLCLSGLQRRETSSV